MNSSAEPASEQLSCESEPIRIPGFIQPHGVLLALDEATLVIEQASENAGRLLGIAAAELVGQSPAAFLGAEQFESLASNFRARPFEVGTLKINAGPLHERMECVYSRYAGSLVVELEPCSGAQALNLLDVSMSLQAPLARMEGTSGIEDLISVVAAEIRALSGFDRVMIYQFDEEWHGTVLAEDVGDRLPLAYRGLRFPASDIPAQARDLYLLNTLRLIPDTEYVPVRLVPTDNPRLGAPLDLSRSELRSVSPIHLEYLRNMGVRATLTISIVLRGKLWGLVACHHASPRRLDHAVRSTCNFFAQMMALKLGARLDHAQLARRVTFTEDITKFVTSLDPTRSFSEALRDHWMELVSLFGADAVYVADREDVALYGSTLSPDDVRPAIACLAERARDGIAESLSLGLLDEAARRYAVEASGALYVDLSGNGDRCLVILRHEQARSVKWAGDPTKAIVGAERSERLSPRASFATWEELKRGESRRWSASDLETAAALRGQLKHWQEAGNEIRLLANYDALTELPNRRHLGEVLNRTLLEAAKRDALVAVMFVDVDRFKRFNDRLGHAAGDSVLRHVAGRLTRVVRAGDIVGRLGGDEFVIIMAALTDPVAAERIAERLLDECSQPIPGIEWPEFRVTLSIGISLYPRDGTTSEALIGRADEAMYHVKEHGRSAWRSFRSA